MRYTKGSITMEDKKIIISIGRECGSGGHEIGEKLAEHYGIKLYDKEMIGLLAEKLNRDPEELARQEEKVTGHWLRGKNGFASQGTMMNKLTTSDRLFLQERDLIRHLAEKESFVIIGRGANAILADDPNTLKLYVYATEEFKIPRVMAQYGITDENEARSKMHQVDKARREYFDYYTGMTWGSSDVHDFMINSAAFGINQTADILIAIAGRKFGV